MEKTKQGILITLIGIFLSFIPFLGTLSGIVILIGIIFFLIGRFEFDDRHRRNVMAATGFYFIVIILDFYIVDIIVRSDINISYVVFTNFVTILVSLLGAITLFILIEKFIDRGLYRLIFLIYTAILVGVTVLFGSETVLDALGLDAAVFGYIYFASVAVYVMLIVFYLNAYLKLKEQEP